MGENLASVPLMMNGTLHFEAQTNSQGMPENRSAGGNETTAAEVLSTMGMTLGILSIILNVVFLIGLQFQKEKASAYNRFVKTLSVADIMASFSFLLIQKWPRGFFAYISKDETFILAHVIPYVFRSWPWMFFTCYMMTLTCLTVNQYVAVCKPWRYSELVTGRRVTTSLVIVWGLSSLQILVPMTVIMILYSVRDKTAAMAALYTISKIEIQIWMAIFMFSNILNIALDVIIYKKIRQLKMKRRFNQMNKSAESLNIRTKQEAFHTVALLLIASLFCRLPFPLAGLISLNLSSAVLNAGIVFLLYLNFFVDPIIYLTRMREVRRFYRGHLRTIVRFISCGKKISQDNDQCEISIGLLPGNTEMTNSVVQHDSKSGEVRTKVVMRNESPTD